MAGRSRIRPDPPTQPGNLRPCSSRPRYSRPADARAGTVNHRRPVAPGGDRRGSPHAPTDHRSMSRRRTIAIGAGLAAGGGAVGRRRTTRGRTDPFAPNAIRAETAAARTADIIAKPRVRRLDLVQTYAPAISTAVGPLPHGR